MIGVDLTKTATEDFKHQVVDTCGWMAVLAADEVFADAQSHGKNRVCQLIDETDHLVVVIDCDCPDKHTEESKPRADSIIGDLCREGVVLYYFHSIRDRHHHVCLALKKRDTAAQAYLGA